MYINWKYDKYSKLLNTNCLPKNAKTNSADPDHSASEGAV